MDRRALGSGKTSPNLALNFLAHLAGKLDVLNLVFTNRTKSSLVNKDICCLETRIAHEAMRDIRPVLPLTSP